MPTIPRIFAWFVLTALFAVGCGAEQPMTPVAMDADMQDKLSRFIELQPRLAKFSTAAESGQFVGAKASQFGEEFKLADEVIERKQKTLYVFYGDPKTGGEEGSPLLVVVVQKKFDLVVSCVITTYDY